MIKRAADLVAEANARVETLSVAKAKPLLGSDDVVFVDVRDGAELARNGKIPGAVHALFVVHGYHEDRRADRIVEAVREARLVRAY